MTFQFELVGDGSPAIYETPTLYKLDSTGRLRTWKMQLDDNGCYRTLSGLADGKQAASGWTTPIPASKPTQKEQGEFEVRSQVKHQLDREYRLTQTELAGVKMQFVEPMLAKTYDKFLGPGTFDFKFDGIRMIADTNGLWSRQGQPITAIPHLHAVLGPLFAMFPDAIIDGEAYNHDLREDFGAISSIVRKKNPTRKQLELAESVMQYHMYDLVTGEGNRDQRKAQLVAMLEASGVSEGWVFVVRGERIETEVQLKQAYGKAIGDGYEGGIYAPDGYEYERGRRSKGLLKMKEFITREYPLLRLEEGQGNWASAAKRAVLRNDDGKEFGAGIRGSYKAGVELLKLELTDESTATVRYFMLSPDGVPRFPVVIDIHPNGRQD